MAAVPQEVGGGERSRRLRPVVGRGPARGVARRRRHKPHGRGPSAPAFADPVHERGGRQHAAAAVRGHPRHGGVPGGSSSGCRIDDAGCGCDRPFRDQDRGARGRQRVARGRSVCGLVAVRRRQPARDFGVERADADSHVAHGSRCRPGRRRRGEAGSAGGRGALPHPRQVRDRPSGRCGVDGRVARHDRSWVVVVPSADCGRRRSVSRVVRARSVQRPRR